MRLRAHTLVFVLSSVMIGMVAGTAAAMVFCPAMTGVVYYCYAVIVVVVDGLLVLLLLFVCSILMLVVVLLLLLSIFGTVGVAVIAVQSFFFFQ